MNMRNASACLPSLKMRVTRTSRSSRSALRLAPAEPEPDGISSSIHHGKIARRSKTSSGRVQNFHVRLSPTFQPENAATPATLCVAPMSWSLSMHSAACTVSRRATYSAVKTGMMMSSNHANSGCGAGSQSRQSASCWPTHASSPSAHSFTRQIVRPALPSTSSARQSGLWLGSTYTVSSTRATTDVTMRPMMKSESTRASPLEPGSSSVTNTRSCVDSWRVEIERPQLMTATRNSPNVISPSRFSSK